MSRTRKLVEEEILRVAAACFSQRGYQATTLEEIASQVGISRVTFYTYFKNKEALLRKIFDHVLNTYQQGLEKILQTPLPRQEKLRRSVAHHIACLTRDPEFVRVFFNEEKNLPPHLAHHIREAQQKIERMLEQEITTGIKRGEIIDANPRLVMYAFVGMCSWLYRWYSPEEAITPEEIVNTFTRILASGSLLQQREKDIPAAERLRRLEENMSEIKRELKKLSRSSHANERREN